MTTNTKDEFAGQGGSYRIDAEGRRVRVQAPTEDHPQGNRPRDAQGRALDLPAEPPASGPAAAPQPEPKPARRAVAPPGALLD